MSHGVEVLRYTAFARDPAGGNPAGVVLHPGDLDDPTMLSIAAEVGYSETAFLWSLEDSGRYRIRYFSPLGEVPFCGHATIASGVALADQGALGELWFETPSGEVSVTVATDRDGYPVATLTSVLPRVGPVDEAVLSEALGALGWSQDDIDPALPAREAFAGAKHLIFGVRSRQRLASMSYDFDRLRRLMEQQGWTTAQLVWRESRDVFDARVPFPVGGVVEDPATGAAAAALGGYLRALKLVHPPARIAIHQGADMGRPSLLLVDIEPGDVGIRVSGSAVPLPTEHRLSGQLPAEAATIARISSP